MKNEKPASAPNDCGFNPLIFGVCVGASVPITRRLLLPMICPGLDDTVPGTIAASLAVGCVGAFIFGLVKVVARLFRAWKPSTARSNDLPA